MRQTYLKAFKGGPLLFGKLKKQNSFSVFSPQTTYLPERNLYLTLLIGGGTVFTLKMWELERHLQRKYISVPFFRLEVNTES